MGASPAVVRPNHRGLSRAACQVIALTVAAIVFSTYACWSVYHQMLAERHARAGSEAQTALLAFEENVVRQLDFADHFLLSARSFYETQGAGEELREFLVKSKPARVNTITGIITIIDRQGRVLFQSETPPDKTPLLPNVSEVDHFIYLRSQKSDGLHIGHTRLGKLSGQRQFRIARPLLKNGEFDGEIVASLNSDHLASYTRNINLGANGFKSIWTTAPRLIAREPAARPEQYETVFSNAPWIESLQKQPSGTLENAVSAVDGIERTVLYRQVADYPLTLVVGIAPGDVENSLTVERRIITFLSLVFALIASGVCWLVLRMIEQNKSLSLANQNATKTKAHLNTLIDTAPDPMLVFGADGRIIRANQMAQQFYGYENGFLLQMGIEQLIPNLFHTAQIGNMADYFAAPQHVPMGAEFTLRALTAQGDTPIVCISLSHYQVNDSVLATLIVRDITEQEKNRAELNEAREHLEQTVRIRTLQLEAINHDLNETQFAMDRVGIGIRWIEVATGQVLYTNDRSCEMLGYSRDEMLALSSTDCVPGQTLDQLKFFAAQTKKQGSLRFEGKNQCKDGSLIPVEIALHFRESAHYPDGILIAFITDISERKQAAQLVHETEERWKYALEGAGEGVWDWNVETGHVVYSPRYMEMLGYSASEAWHTIDDWKDHVVPEDMSRAMVQLEAYLDGKIDHFSTEYRMRCKNGDNKWIQARGKVYRAENNWPWRVIGTHTDISTLKQASEDLRHSEERFRDFSSSSADWFWEMDETLHFCYFSDLFAPEINHLRVKALGKTRGEILAIDNLNPPGEVAAHCQLLEQHLPFRNFEYAIRNELGGVQWISVSGIPHFEPNGNFAGYRGTGQDITEQKRSHENLLKLSRAVENSPASVVITNVSGSIEYVNRRFTETTGYSREEAIGRTPSLISSGIHSKEFYGQLWSSILAGNEWHGEIHNRRKNGELMVESVLISPIRDDSGAITHFVAVKEDITERRRITEELLRAKNLAEESNRLKSDFLATMSHEIRTPMNGIIGLTHLCLQTDLSGQQKSYLKQVERSAHALLRIINDILDLSKIEAGQIEMEESELSLAQVIDNVIAIAAAKCEEKNLEFLLSVDQRIPRYLVGDPLRLSQILINLTNNAVKFTEQGEIGIDIQLESSTRDTATLHFSVSDTGIGITQEQIKKLFQPFVQADSSTTRRFGGSGLGLSISKRLVEMMRGQIWVDSAPEQGSTFHFTVTLGRSREAPRQALPPMPRDIHRLPTLLVDDNSRARQTLFQQLQSFTFAVSQAASGPDALALFEQAAASGSPYRLVIVDWKMPEMDGLAIARRIRELAPSATPPVILLLSLYGHNVLAAEPDAMQIINGVVSKPVQSSALFDSITDAFGYPPRDQGADLNQNTPASQFYFPGLNVLLAEDNEINQQVARELLQRVGARISIAPTCSVALDCCAGENFDVVLMDIQMPDMDGLEATRKLRQRGYRVPIIAMTANAMSGDRQRCLDAGMNDYISKPIEPVALYQALKQQLPEKFRQLAAATPPVESESDFPCLEGIDTRTGLRRVGRNESLYRTILVNFAERHGGFAGEIRALLELPKERETALRKLHTIKGLAGSIGAEGLAKAARELESRLQTAGHGAAWLDLLPPVEIEMKKVLAGIASLPLLLPAPQPPLPLPQDVAPDYLAGLIREAIDLLGQYKSEAEIPVNKLCSGLASTRWSDFGANLNQSMRRYDYEKALKQLQEIAHAMELGEIFEQKP